MIKNILKTHNKKSIFRSLFVPVLMILVLQSVIFYFAAVYGGVKESLTQNAVDILSERLINRKNEIETRFNNKWTNLDNCTEALESLYSSYENLYGDKPLTGDKEIQIQYLSESASLLIDTLRHNEVNGIFLILNDQPYQRQPENGETQQKYGLCIRDMDQESNYSDRKDLLIERAPSSIIDSLDCSLDSWWEAKYSLVYGEKGDFYFSPLKAAWENDGAEGSDLAYLSDAYKLSVSDPAMIAYSIPLIGQDGYPFAVVGVELSIKYINSLLPNKELNEADKCCYVLALQQEASSELDPITAVGTLYTRCFDTGSLINSGNTDSTGGFSVTGRGDIELYGVSSQLDIYNTNNPFDYRQLKLVALVERQTLFSYVGRIKTTLLLVSVVSAVLGIIFLNFVSHRFASPISALAQKVRATKEQKDFKIERLGITEIDQLVDSVEELNRTVNKNSARTEFFSRMSHDMRTPMNAIISFSSPEFTDGADEATKDDYIKKIHASGEYLLALINEVLDMTKIESNKIDLHSDAVKADSIFSGTIPIIEKLAQKKNISFVKSIQADSDLYIVADAQHLNQIVVNLLSNAVKFTPDGGNVKLFVEMTDDASDDTITNCTIKVADDGIGMSEDFADKLYEPFEQENGGLEGTGLGLSIAKKLIDLMGGTIDCESEKGKGTTFTLSFPFKKSEASENEPTVGIIDVESVKNHLSGKKILVCEDNTVNTEIICRLLNKIDIEVTTVENGKEGVDAFMSSEINEYCAILMDIRMPVLDGLEASVRIRALNRPDAAAIPIIAMTANAFAKDVEDCRKAGMTQHLAKPIEPQKLFSALMKYIK